MTDILTLLESLCRPRILIQAARIGLCDYNRARDLGRLLRVSALPHPGQAIASLMNEERHLEEKRNLGEASYSIARHVEVLIALMGEAGLLRARRAAERAPA